MTENEREADRFDCDLYGLMASAETRAEDGDWQYRREWALIAQYLSSARSVVRSMMNKRDIEATR